jgi:hypothetical protein
MLRITSIAGGLAAASLALAPATGLAQNVQETLDRIDQLQQQATARQRAMNLARNTAVTLNGGLTQYIPAACMFTSGSSGGSCMVGNDSKGFLFRFNGGKPGWQEAGQPPTITTEILISPDGRTVQQLIYNGPAI